MRERRSTAPGDVVLVTAPGAEEGLPAVHLAEGEDAVTVIPLSAEAHLATEWDLVLPEQVLGYAAIAQVWNYGSVLPEQLGDLLSRLDATLLETLRGVARAAVAGASPPADAPVGPPVLDDADPRLLFQEEEAERSRALWEPALALAGSLTLGQLVAHRREELRVPAHELEALGAGAGWLPELERDEVDVRHVLSAASLATVMRRLQINASRRLGRIAAFTLETQGAGGGAALARGRYADDEGGVPPVGDYVEEFLDELGKS